MSPGQLAPVVAVPLALLLFAGFWVAVTSLLAHLTGWPALAAEYPGGEEPQGERLRGMVYGFRRVNENRVTTLVATPKGLYLTPMRLFRLGRPPVLVPWNRVRYEAERSFLWGRWHDIDLAGITTMRVAPALLPVLRRHGVSIPGTALA
ncbi:MAG: hypothetical protein IPG75_13350 [Gemmatimonadetes bacterium]|nr:hypothetical protein [Gemmatimonadota bacterium]